MRMWKTNQKNEIFQVLGGRTNSYLILCDEGNILVDTGVRSSLSELRKQISKLHLASGKIDYLILTHTHFDHCRNTTAIKEENACEVLVGEPEARFIEKGYTPIPHGTNPLTRFIVKIGNNLDPKWFSYEPFSAELLIGDYYNFIDSDIKIELISTPGHSPGSISLIIDDDIAIVGDVLFGIFERSVFPPFADDLPALINSWERLLKTGCSVFLPGHGGQISRDLLEKEYRKYAGKYLKEKLASD
jgi:hydroxyacylglutathione hydrolase